VEAAALLERVRRGLVAGDGTAPEQALDAEYERLGPSRLGAAFRARLHGSPDDFG
jgi:hypothetical protein